MRCRNFTTEHSCDLRLVGWGLSESSHRVSIRALALVIVGRPIPILMPAAPLVIHVVYVQRYIIEFVHGPATVHLVGIGAEDRVRKHVDVAPKSAVVQPICKALKKL